MAGLVTLVGAGPGDPELITLKGKLRLEQADAVLYDDLANAALLDYAPARAERIYVGKRAGRHAATQEQIGAWLVERARRGWRVVRLKGGDPFIFGRGGEEVEALAGAGVEWEVVPGISAANGAAAAACLPLTHREFAAGVRFTTGPSEAADGKPETLVVFMGLEAIERWTARLLEKGWRAETPVAIVENATLPEQRLIVGQLDTIAERAGMAAVRTPALVIVGEVVRWRERLTATRPCRSVAAVEAEAPAGLILMGHGSPLPGWQAGVARLAAEVGGPGQFSRAAFLPPVAPGLGEVVGEAVAAGVRRLAVVPYFLAAGLHVTRDLPDLVAAERRRFPQLRIELAACLEGHPALRTVVLARAGEAGGRLEFPAGNEVTSMDGREVAGENLESLDGVDLGGLFVGR